MEIKCVSRCKEWQEIKSQDIGGFRVYTYGNQWIISQKEENTDKATQLLIWGVQCRWNKEWRGDQGGTFGNWNQQTQRNTGSSSNGLRWNRYVFRLWLASQV